MLKGLKIKNLSPQYLTLFLLSAIIIVGSLTNSIHVNADVT